MNGLFGLNGMLGYAIVVVALLVFGAVLGFKAVAIQRQEATHYYQLDAKNLQMFEKNGQQLYKAPKE